MLYLGPEVKFYFSSEIDYNLIGAQFMLSDRFGVHLRS